MLTVVYQGLRVSRSSVAQTIRPILKKSISNDHLSLRSMLNCYKIIETLLTPFRFVSHTGVDEIASQIKPQTTALQTPKQLNKHLYDTVSMKIER